VPILLNGIEQYIFLIWMNAISKSSGFMQLDVDAGSKLSAILKRMRFKFLSNLTGVRVDANPETGAWW
jgi:hypothetical protein